LKEKRLSEIPAHIAQSFDNLLTKKGGLAIVPIEDLGNPKKYKDHYYSCSGCNVILPYMVVEKVKFGNDVVQCPSCFRYVYHPSWLDRLG